MSPILNLRDEYARIDAPDFRLGEYLYLGQIRTSPSSSLARASANATCAKSASAKQTTAARFCWTAFFELASLRTA